MWKKITKYLNDGDARSIAAKKNTIKLAIVKIVTVAISFLLIPLTINYVSLADYGVWLALSSVIAWLSVFDIGISNGLRNKLSEAYAHQDWDLSQKLVSTAYALLIFIFTPLMFALFLLNCFVDWSIVLKVTSDESNNLQLVVLILIGYFCIRFILSIVNAVLLATHNAALASYSGLLEQTCLILIILVLHKTVPGSLLNLTIAVFVSSVGALTIYSIYIYRSVCSDMAPSISKVDVSLSRGLLTLGISFFVIQFAGIVQFQTANILLLRYLGPEDVANYNVALKYFYLMPTIMGILLTPFWSAVTDAYAKQDYEWIKEATRKYKKIAFLIIFAGLVMLAISDYIYRLWLGNEVKVSFNISLWMYVFCALLVYGSVYSMVLNGAGALRIQFIACLISPFVFLASSYLLMNFTGMGVSAIIVASIISNFNGYILGPWQYRKIFG